MQGDFRQDEIRKLVSCMI